MLKKFKKWVSDHPILCAFLSFIILLIFYLIWKNGADASNKFAGIFTPLIVAGVTIYLSNRQHNIADAQRAVAEESKNIAASNRDIADRKLKLELFDKRYEIYDSVMNFYLFSLSMNKKASEYIYCYEVNSEETLTFYPEQKCDLYKILEKAKNDRVKLDKKYTSEILFIEKSQFIFSKDVFEEFSFAINRSYKIGIIYTDDVINNLNYIIEMISYEKFKYENNYTISKKDLKIIEDFKSYMKNKISEKLSDYLDISSINTLGNIQDKGKITCQKRNHQMN